MLVVGAGRLGTLTSTFSPFSSFFEQIMNPICPLQNAPTPSTTGQCWAPHHIHWFTKPCQIES